MDGITALSLAVNIIQVVVWGRQVIGVLKGGEIYQTQRDAATNFQSATGSLQKQLSLQPQPITAEDQSLLQIARTCETAADKLLKELGPTDDANRLKLAMKAPFKGSGIKKLEEELAFCQRVLETQLLVGMRKNIDLTALRTDQQFDNLSYEVQHLALKMEDGKTELSQILDDQTKRMTSLENQSADIATAIGNLQLGASFRKLEHDHPQVHLLLSSLLFPTMFSRRDQIPPNYPDTYKWALKSPEELKQSYHPSVTSPNLLEWIREGDGLYWVSGKAGSGKSTFMKFVGEQESMRTALNTWSGDSKALIATHFFWSQGNELQRSRIGLLRSILYQLISSCPALISFFGNAPHVGHLEWTESRLVDAIFAIASQNTTLPLKFCFFVDGMDESMGNPTELLDLLCAVTSNKNLKCVVSSRPWAVFHKRLNQYPQIRLQELTDIDIRRFVSGKINAASSPVPLSKSEIWKITDSLVGKAEGVFLWVSLATASILDGIESGDDYDELQSRINELPTRLEELYGTIVSHIEERYRIQAMRIFTLLLLETPHQSLRPSVLSMSLVDLGDSKRPKRTSSDKVNNLDSVMEECNRTFLHLQQRCGGLLHFQFSECSGKLGDMNASKIPKRLDSLEQAESLQVQFLHRTVFDFFHKYPKVLGISATDLSHPWDPLVARAEACIRTVEVKIQGTQGPSMWENLRGSASSLPTALLSIRCVELEQCTAQRAMLERLDIQGKILLRLIGEDTNFAPEVHWCVLFCPREVRESIVIGSGSMTSFAELCAYSGLVQTALVGLPQLSPEKCTAALNCTMNGLTYPRDGHYQSGEWPWMNAHILTPSACIEEDKFAIKDFKARVSLISEFLRAGGCPNTKMVYIARKLRSSENSSGLRRIQERFVTEETAWCHLLKMLRAEFYWGFCSKPERRVLHNLDTVASWADMTQGFIDHHANPRQLVQNLSHIIKFSPKWKDESMGEFKVKFDFESEPLPIIASYFQSNVLGQRLLNKMTQREGQNKVRFKTVQLQAGDRFRDIFVDIFGVENPSHMANGTSWDISNGVLDHLGTRILSSNQPLWDTQDTDDEPLRGSISDFRFDPWKPTTFDLWEVALQKKPRPHTLEVLREVFIVLSESQQKERLDSTIRNESRAYYCPPKPSSRTR